MCSKRNAGFEEVGHLVDCRRDAAGHAALLEAAMHVALDLGEAAAAGCLQLDAVDMAAVENEEIGDAASDAE